MTTSKINGIKADLRTAQNRMLPFVHQELSRLEETGQVDALSRDTQDLEVLCSKVQERFFDLLRIPKESRHEWHIGIADSGKRAIALTVNYFCPATSEGNVVVNHENYSAFNKFSAATVLTDKKGVEFAKPFGLRLGQALTVNSESEFEKAKALIQSNVAKTLWIAWNSTSTGIQERVERLVAFRNQCESQTLIIADAASQTLFTNKWSTLPHQNYPDAFFFSLRKQSLPYDGPQDEINQARNSGAVLIFNEMARQRAKEVGVLSVNGNFDISEITKGKITQENQRNNHIKHLLKLRIALEHFLGNGGAELDVADAVCNTARSEVLTVFTPSGRLRELGFSLISDPDAQSSSTYILSIPEHLTASSLISSLRDRGIEISVSTHSGLDAKKVVRFAFYPGNTLQEIELLLAELPNCLNSPN